MTNLAVHRQPKKMESGSTTTPGNPKNIQHDQGTYYCVATLAKSNIKDACILFSTSLSSFWGNLVDCPTPHDKSEKLLSLWMKEYDAPRDDLQELNPITDYWRITVPRLVVRNLGKFRKVS